MLRRNEKKSTKYTLLCLLVFYVLFCEGNQSNTKAQVTEIGNFKPITPIASTVKFTATNSLNIVANKDGGLNKRNIQFKELGGTTAAAAATGKSYDPPPEYYRGSGSTVSTNSGTSNAYSSQDNAAAGFIAKPVTFPDTAVRSKYSDSNGEYNSLQLLRGPAAQGYDNGQDRISVGHYGSPDHSTTHGGSASSFLHSSGISAGYGGYGYGYDTKRPYDAYHNGYSGGAPQYPVSTHGGADSHYYDSHEANGIPFDVYGTKGHYAGAGGEYSYSSYPDIKHPEPAAHKGHGVDWQQKALLAKSFLIPLASAAVLGIAAALVSNPLLLQLGTVSGPTLLGKRRKRRDLGRTNARLAYRAHRRL